MSKFVPLPERARAFVIGERCRAHTVAMLWCFEELDRGNPAVPSLVYLERLLAEAPLSNPLADLLMRLVVPGEAVGKPLSPGTLDGGSWR